MSEERLEDPLPALGQARTSPAEKPEDRLEDPFLDQVQPQSSGSWTCWDLVVPVPSHPHRLLWRGYDHVHLMVRWALRSLTPPHRPGPRLARSLLRRIRNTVPQVSLDGPLRRTNVVNAFTADTRIQLQGLRVLVVDDVTTTGATLHQCIQALEQAGARTVHGLALLRTLA